MITPLDCDVRQSGRVLKLQNSDPRLRPTDLSWHFPILVVIREDRFKKCRSRTIVQEQRKNGRPSSRRPRSRKHHLGHGINLYLRYLHLGNTEARERSDWKTSSAWSSSCCRRHRGVLGLEASLPSPLLPHTSFPNFELVWRLGGRREGGQLLLSQTPNWFEVWGESYSCPDLLFTNIKMKTKNDSKKSKGQKKQKQ